MRDFMHLPLVTVALLFLLPGSAAGQISMQRQMPGYSNGPSLSASANRNLTDAPSRLANSELRVVPADFAKLILAPGFLVQLNVLDDSDFTGDFRIDELGNITVPVVGTMHIAGQTASEARTQIVKQLLEGKFLKDPQLTLKVLEYTAPQVTIIGEVGHPESIPCWSPATLWTFWHLLEGRRRLLEIKSRSSPAMRKANRFSSTIRKPQIPKSSEM